MKNRIYIDNWLSMKPYRKQVPSDFFYLVICNELKSTIVKKPVIEGIEYYLIESEFDGLLCFLTSYLEDLISETNLWNTFIYLHKDKYDKRLPFYNIDEYFEDEINISDVQFLIWYFVNTIQNEYFLHPDAKLIAELSTIIFEVFDKKWDYAPVNKELKEAYRIDENSSDYYEVRQVMDKIIFQSYLFYPDTALDLKFDILDFIEEREGDENTGMLLNEKRDHSLHNFKTALLALPGKSWTAALVGVNHKLFKDIQNMSKRISGLFLYKGKNDKYILLEHIASGLRFDLLKSSYEYEVELNEVDTIFFVGMVKWQSEWWFSGISFTQPFDANRVLDLKNNIMERSKVSFLQDQSAIIEAIDKQHKNFLEYNNNSPLIFIKANQINNFIDNFHEYCLGKLGKNEKEKSEQRAQKDGLFDKDESFAPFDNDDRQGLIFFNPISGIEVAFNINDAFIPSNSESNDDEYTETSIVEMLMSIATSKELISYWSEHYNLLSDFQDNPILKAYQSDSDFLLRYWKKANYHTQPSVTLFG